MTQQTQSYRVDVDTTSGLRQVGDYTSLRAAKRAAWQAWRERPGVSVSIISETGRIITASQAIGRGMLWGQ